MKDYYEDKKGVVLDEPPKDECEASDFEDYQPNIDFTSSGSYSSQDITLTSSVDAPYGVSSVKYSANGNSIGSTSSKPYSMSYSVPSDKNGSEISITVEVTDKNGNTASDSGTIKASF